MATSLEERLKLKQYQVDTWTTREQLCLASAVMRSGDQNWVAVRRNIKMLTNEASRPPDWYSTKNCALQYAKLLECVDTPKRKRERGDASNETPGEIVTKMLSKQRVEELRAAEAEERSDYNKLRREIQQLEDGLLDNQLDAFWEELQRERAEQEEEERKHQQWLKEREEKITAIQQALKHQGPKVPVLPNKKKQKLQWPGSSGGFSMGRRNSGLSETSSEVDSAVDSPEVSETVTESLAPEENVTQEPEPKPTPPSPLLSSLLNKSPITSASGSSTSPLPQLNLGSKSARGSGVSPVSMALQNLVNSAISGTDANKDTSAKTSRSPSLSGSSTLSRLLDLPPSNPGAALPRLPDISGPVTETKDEDSSGDSTSQKNEEEKKEDSKDCPNVEEIREKEQKPKADEVPKEDDTKEMEVEESKEGRVEDIKMELQTEENKGEQELQEQQTEKAEKNETLKEEKEKVESKETEEVMEMQFIVQEKAEEKVKESEDVKGDISLEDKGDVKKADEKPDKEADGKDIKKKELKQDKFDELLREKDKKKKEEKCPKQEEPNKEKEKEKEKEKKEDVNIVKKSDESKPPKSEDKEVKEEKPVVSESEKKKENKKNEEMKPKEKKKEDEKANSKKKAEEDEERANKKKKTEEEEEKNTKNKPSEEQKPAVKKLAEEEGKETDTESDKKKTKSQKKEQEEDSQDGQESKDWVSEVERIFVRSTKRKVSGGDFAGSSSPLITESAPNSPASTHYGDDPEHERSYRSWKKPIMILWNEIAAHKFASLFLRPITDDQAPGYHSVVYRPMDLQTIKRNIESGVIRNTAEFQRDMMLMFLNAKMYNTSDHNVYHMAHQMMKDTVSTIEEFLNTQMLARAEETPQKSLRRETRESSAKRSDDDPKRKSRDSLDEKSLKKRRL
ncbi:bromodomain-containing protein 8-like isoform X2 [Penaeus chinensis]|uniref:bromodomain-containing protein 8-like isoform X2 n=1 Tax=Penaeus chinensis TaxID=139456 RepID=UPI001FB779F0|nr:bromodomain-containing protein 8-like isoform X2 [Penaeus chinensis]